MIAEIGHYALILALLVALVQGTLPLIGAQTGNAAWMAVARPASVGQMLFIGISFGCLTYAYVGSDFSVMNVAQNPHTGKPRRYKISGGGGKPVRVREVVHPPEGVLPLEGVSSEIQITDEGRIGLGGQTLGSPD